jgi:hypothetical protein
VEASWFDAGSAFVVFDDHRRSNWTTYVYATTDYGKTWKSLATDEIDGFAHVIRQDRVSENLLFVGTEFGLFFSLDGGGSWTKWTKGLPTAPVRDVGIHPREHDLIIGTHGRSAYIIDDISPLRTLSDEILKKRLHLFDLTDAIHFRRGRLSAISSAGDTEFKGTNKTLGAAFSYVLNPVEKKEGEKPERDESAMGRRAMTRPGGKSDVKITILDAEGKKVRSLDGTEEKGINRVYWDMTHEPPPPPPGMPAYFRRFVRGLSALPGAYTVKVRYHDSEVSGVFQVLNDPRLNIDTETLKENFKIGEEVMALSSILRRARKEIGETRKLIHTIRDYGKGNKSPEWLAVKKSCGELEKKLTTLSEKISPDTSKIQGISDRSAGLNSQVRMLSYAGGRSHLPLTQAVKVKYKKVKADVLKFMEEFNRFYTDDVARLQKSVEESGFSLFKEFEPLSLEAKAKKRKEDK